MNSNGWRIDWVGGRTRMGRGGTRPYHMICHTFSDCDTAPRNGMIAGCYPLDKYDSAKPEFQRLKEVEKKVLAKAEGLASGFKACTAAPAIAKTAQFIFRDLGA